MESVETEPKQLRVELLQIALVSNWTRFTYHLCCTVRWPYFLALQSEHYWPATIVLISSYWNEWPVQYRGTFCWIFLCYVVCVCYVCLFCYVVVMVGDCCFAVCLFFFFYKFQIIHWNKNPELKDEELRHEGVKQSVRINYISAFQKHWKCSLSFKSELKWIYIFVCSTGSSLGAFST